MAVQKNLGEAVVHVRATVHGMKDLADLKNALQNFGNGLQGFSGNMRNAGSAIQIAAEASRVTLRNMRHLSFAMRDAGRQALGFSVALAAAFAPIIIEGARFEQSVANVRAVMGDLREDNVSTAMTMEELSKQFIHLGEISEFSSVQVAQAAKSLALAGFSATELKNALPTVVNLASAAGTELERTAEIVANISRSFGLEANNFTRVGDILTQTFTNSNTTLESLAETMKLLAPVASSLGLSLEEAAAAVGVLGDRGVRGCYDGETEVLTTDGWIRWDKATKEHIYATVNKSHEVEYHPALEYIRYPYVGKMYKVTNRSTDLLVTPNHNMYVDREGAHGLEGGYGLHRADEVFGKPYRFLNSVSNPAPDVAFFELEGIVDRNKGFYRDHVPSLKIPMDLWLQFLGLYLSEGSCAKDKRGNYRVYLSQNKDTKAFPLMERVLTELEKLGLGSATYYESNRSFKLFSQQLYNYVHQFGHAVDKFVPDFVFNCSQRQLRLFLDAYRQGDGDFNAQVGRYFNIYTSSTKMANDLSRIGILAGYGVNAKTQKTKVAIIGGREIRPSTEITHIVSFKVAHLKSWNSPKERRRNRPRLTGERGYGESWVDFSGMVYCVEVPNNTLIVRRNGKVVVCGNSLAGTGLARVFNQLREESDKFAEALEAVGSSYDRIDLTRNSLVEVVREFEKIQKISNQDFLNIAEIFDERAARSFINLVQGGADAFESLLTLNQQAAGVADAIRQIRLDTLAGDAERLKSNFQSLLAEAFAQLQPRLREIVQSLIDLVDWVRALIKDSPKLVENLANIAEILITMVAPIGLILLGFGKMVAFASGFFSFRAAIAGAQAQFALLNATIAATGANATAAAAAMTRLQVASILFQGVAVAAFTAMAAAVGVVLGLKLHQWVKNAAHEANIAKGVYRELNLEIERLIANSRKAIQANQQQSDNIKAAIETLQKGGNLTEKDFEELKRLTGTESGLGQVQLSQQLGQFRAVNDKINELNDQALALEQKLNAAGFNTQGIYEIFFTAGRARRASEQDILDNLKKQIADLEGQAKDLIGSIKETKKSIKDYDDIRLLLLQGNEKVASTVKADLDRLIAINDEIKNLNDSFSSATTPEQRADATNRLSILQKEKELLEARASLLKPLVGTLGDTDFLAQAGGNFDAALQAFLAWQEAQAKAKKDAEDIRAAEESFKMSLDDVDASLKKNAETLQEKVQAIRDAEQAQLDYLKAAMAVAQLENNMADVLRIENLEWQLKQKSLEEQKALIDEANAAQEETIDGLKLERAERDKNVAEFEKLKRKVGQAAIQEEANDLFQLTGDPAQDAAILARQKEFIRLKEEELNLDIEGQKKDWEDEAKKAKEAAAKKEKALWKERKQEIQERDDIEKDILKSLAGQAKNAQELAYFLSLIHQLEKKREEAVFSSQRKAFRMAAMLEALDRRRAKLAAAGEDTKKIDELIRRKKQEFLLRDAIFRQRQKEVGLDVGGTGFDPSKIPDTVAATMTPGISDILNNITTLFAAAPVMWVDALLKAWSEQLGRLGGGISLNTNGTLPALPGLPSVPGAMPPPVAGITNRVEINVNNNGADLDLLRRSIRDALNSAGMRV